VPPLVGIGGCDWASGAELARIVDEQIQWAERTFDRGDGFRHLLAVG